MTKDHHTVLENIFTSLDSLKIESVFDVIKNRNAEFYGSVYNSTKTLLPKNSTTHVKHKVNGNCLEKKPTPCIFRTDLNDSEDIGLSENLIQFNPSKCKSIKISAFNRTNKDVWLEKRTAIGRSSRPEVFCKKVVLRNFAKFTGKHLCQSIFFNKVAGLRAANLFKKRLWHRCFPMNFVKFLRAPFLQNTSRQLLLKIKKLFQQPFQLKLKTFKSMTKPLKSVKREILISKIATTKINFCRV